MKSININNLICDKGDMILKSYVNSNNSSKSYILNYTYKNVDLNKINIDSLLGNNIFNLLEKLNNELIEKIYILNETDGFIDVCILLKQIAKEIGIKQKYLLFRSIKKINKENYSIIFNIKDIKLIDENLYDEYLKKINIKNNSNYESLLFTYGYIKLYILNCDKNIFDNIFNSNKINTNITLDIDFELDFNITTTDILPIYMEDLIGLLIKKLFFNLKQFVDNLNRNI